VIGLGFGDEGKGMVTDYLCSKSYNPLVVRFSGGHQAGHTVVKENKRHVFSNFGSGTLCEAHTYWSPFCTVEPCGLIKELDILLDINESPTLFIDAKCPVTTYYDIYHNHLIEGKQKHGTCGVGFGSTIEREESMYSLRAGDLFHPVIVELKMGLIKKYYNNLFCLDDSCLAEFYKSIEKLIQSSCVNIISNNPLSSYENIIFEGSQGLLLDQNIGFFPHVTRSNTGTKNILPFGYSPSLYLITRAYQTRHGSGIMTNEEVPHNIAIDENETNINNKYQGMFRRSLLDLDLILYGISRDEYIAKNISTSTLVITCIDHIKNEYRFTHNKKIIICDNEIDFVGKIAHIIGVGNVLISRTPYSSELESYKRPA